MLARVSSGQIKGCELAAVCDGDARRLAGFARPEVRLLAASGNGGQYNEILANFVAAIREGQPLLAPAAEGLHSVELANAMILSFIRERPPSANGCVRIHRAARRVGRRVTQKNPGSVGQPRNGLASRCAR